MFCNNCGAKIENDDAKFCPKCGNKFNKSDINGINTSDKSDNTVPSTNISSNNNESNNNNFNKSIKANKGNDNKIKDKIKTNYRTGENKGSKGLWIGLISFIIIFIISGGALVYFHQTGKLKMQGFLHLNILSFHKKPESSVLTSKISKSKKSSKSKNSKLNSAKKINRNKITSNNGYFNSSSSNNNNKVNASIQPNASPTYVYSNNNKVAASNNSNANYSSSQSQSAYAMFRDSLGLAHASITSIQPDVSLRSNIPALIVAKVVSDGGSVFQGKNITLNSSFEVKMPTNLASQSLKLIYKITGNGLVAYNYSYINVNKPGIYDVGLTVDVPSDFPIGTYIYTLTAESSATIEESAAAVFKVQ